MRSLLTSAVFSLVETNPGEDSEPNSWEDFDYREWAAFARAVKEARDAEILQCEAMDEARFAEVAEPAESDAEERQMEGIRRKKGTIGREENLVDATANEVRRVFETVAVEMQEEEGVRASSDVNPTQRGWRENEGPMSQETMEAVHEFEITVQRMVGELREKGGDAFWDGFHLVNFSRDLQYVFDELDRATRYRRRRRSWLV